MAAIAVRSNPAQNDGPWPLSTTQRTSGRPAIAAPAPARASNIGMSKALRLSGLDNCTWATPSLTSIDTRSLTRAVCQTALAPTGPSCETAAMRLNLTADDVLTTTRAVRKRLDFDRPVERAVLEECLQIALQAPTGSNRQGWQWIFVTDPDLKAALADIYRPNFEAYRRMVANASYPDGDARAARVSKVYDSASYLAEHFHRVPVILVPCVEGTRDPLPGAASASMWGSLLPAVWSFMLAARERGLGTAWTTLHLLNNGDNEAAHVLGIPPGWVQAGMFPIAYTVGTDFKPAARRPIGDLVHWDRW